MKLQLDRMTDRQLLELRLCDLPVRIRGTQLEQRIKKLYRELEARSLKFRPHVWLSEEWFTPDGVGGFAIPFYLAHPRLIKLERAQMLEVEGASDAECMRILRHEAGHAIDNAFRLHTRTSNSMPTATPFSLATSWISPASESTTPATAYRMGARSNCCGTTTWTWLCCPSTGGTAAGCRTASPAT